MEYWKYNPEDPEEPHASLSIGNGEHLEATRDNARLYTFLGKAACMNHIYISTENSGAYIFNFIDGFDVLSTYMIENEYPMYLNQTEVPQCDINAYDRAIKNLSTDTDYLPEDWE